MDPSRFVLTDRQWCAIERIGAICDLYHPTECPNCFKAAGYVSNQNRNALTFLSLPVPGARVRDSAGR